MKRLTTLLYLGSLLTLPLTTLTLAAPPTAAGDVVAQVSPQQLQQRAASITVKVLAGERSGSGVIIKRNGDTYSVLTNRHVVESGTPLRVQTPDGEVYQNVEVVSQPALANLDLAILEFGATAEYATAPLANLSEVRAEEEVFAAGYPFAANPNDAGGLVVTGGRLLLLPERELKEGYRLGYEGDIEKGMSGGPIFNGEGEVVGINGIHAYPLWGDPYVFEDGSKPTAEQREVMSRLNWGIPIQILAELVPGYVPLEAATVAATPVEGAIQPLSYDVERVAERITVLIRWGSGNGSGVIVARRGDVYYVLTAEHVARYKNVEDFKIVTHDGEQHEADSLKTMPGVDLAVMQFKSDANYPVAAVADYDSGLMDDKGFVFASGWRAVTGGEPERRFSAGKIYSQEFGRLQGWTRHSFSYGYGLVYTNLTGGGMSGGPILDSRGRLLGIHGRAEGAAMTDGSGSVGVVYLGYSLGVPIKSFLSSAANLGVKRDWLLLKNDPPPPPSEAEVEAILQREFAALGMREECRDAVECVNYGNKLWRLQRGEEALAVLQRASQMDPSLYAAWYVKGLALFSEGEYEEAAVAFEMAGEVGRVAAEQSASAWRWRGEALWNLNRYEEALESVERAIAQSEKDFAFHALRGQMLQELQRHEEAIAAYDRAVALNPHSWVYNNRGVARVYLGSYREAIADYNQALALNPGYAEAYRNRGFARYSLADYQRAMADFEIALQLKPDFALAYSDRANVLIVLGDGLRAMENFNKALELDPNLTSAYINRGRLHFVLGDGGGAIADFDRAIALEPNNPQSYFYRGNARHKQGDYRAAVADYQQAVALDDKLLPAIVNIGLIEYELGASEAAIQSWQAAIAISAEAVEPQLAIAAALYARGDLERGLAMAEGALRLDSRYGDVEVLKQNLWGEKLVADARKLLETSKIRALLSRAK